MQTPNKLELKDTRERALKEQGSITHLDSLEKPAARSNGGNAQFL